MCWIISWFIGDGDVGILVGLTGGECVGLLVGVIGDGDVGLFVMEMLDISWIKCVG